MSSPTTNFGWLKPTIGGDNDIWGDELNTNLDNQDSLVRRAINTFISNTAPSEFQSGTEWIDNTSNPWNINVYDGTQWITTGTINPVTHNYSPAGLGVNFYVGDYKFSGQTTNHGSWLVCNGTAVSTTTYSGLFALIGYNFGGSGSTFNLPDLRGSVPAAIGTGSYSGASTRTLGQFVGEERHTLTTPEIPSHNHFTTSAESVLFPPALSNSNQMAYQWNQGFGTENYLNYNIQGSTLGATIGNSSSTGGGGGHNTMQPTVFVGNYFIYSGV